MYGPVPNPKEMRAALAVLRMNEDCRIEEFEEKPMVSTYNTVSTGIYVIRRRQLIELIEKCCSRKTDMILLRIF